MVLILKGATFTTGTQGVLLNRETAIIVNLATSLGVYYMQVVGLLSQEQNNMIQSLTLVQKGQREGIQGNSGWREQTRASRGKDNDFELESP